MKIHHNIKKFKGTKPVVTIGTFDGVHLGHQKVIKRLTDIAHEHGGESVIFTFAPHPRLVTSTNGNKIWLLTTMEEKKQLFERLGIDHMIIYPFTRTFADMKYSEFVKNILIDKINTFCLVIGYDHRFGQNREGNFEYLQMYAKQYKFKIEKLKPLVIDNIHVSSTTIRQALHKGEILKASRYLGYRYTIEGQVVEGFRVGRKIGFPTANIEVIDKNKLIPGDGVYAVEIIVYGEKYSGMLNIGTRPTFYNNRGNRAIEVHIFDLSKNIYHQKITIIFFDKIRDEKKFQGIKQLTEQLKKDKSRALKILSGNI